MIREENREEREKSVNKKGGKSVRYASYKQVH